MSNNNVFTVNGERSMKRLLDSIPEICRREKWTRWTYRTGLTRTEEQNSKMWPLLQDISDQVVWYGKTYSKESWKEIITGSFRKVDFVPAIDGDGFVATGLSTRSMGRKEFSDLIEFIYAFGASKDVVWSERAERARQEVQDGESENKENM